MKKRKFVIVAFYSLGFLILLFLALVVIIYFILFYEVRRNCIRAQAIYKTSCIESLEKVLESDRHTIREKNDAIWVLGQIADERSLPALKKIYTGQIPEREPLDKMISQYEIKKAIHWVEDGNWTSWMYFMYH